MAMIFSDSLNKLCTCLLVLFGSFGLAQGQTYTLNGEVLQYGSSEGIVGVKVTVHETNKQVYTDSTGSFLLQLKKGHYHLHFEKKDFAALDLDVDLDEARQVQVFLSPTRLEISEVLIEDSYLRNPNSTNSKEVLSLSPSRANQAQAADLGSLLDELPGITMLNTGIGISKPVIRGFMGNRVAVIDQGIKQEGQQWGMDHGLEVDPFQADRMEVVKGPAALQYGSDAIGGALKILPTLAPQKKNEASLQGLYHSNNSALGFSAMNAFKSGGFHSRLRFSHRQFQDFQVPAETFTYNGFILPISDGLLKNTAGNLNSLRWDLGWQSADYRARYTFSYYRQEQGLYPGATGIPRAYDVGQIGDRGDIALPRQEIDHYKVYSFQAIRIADHWLEMELGFQRNQRAERSLPHAHGFEELDSSATLALGLNQDSWQVNARYPFHFLGQELVLGTAQNYKHNRQSGFEFLIPSFWRHQSGLFALTKGKLSEKWHWDGGLRWEYQRVVADETSSPWWQNIDSLALRSEALNRSFSNLAGAFGVAYNPSPFWRLKAHVARSFRAPNIAELASNGVHHGTFRHEQGQVDMDPEQAWQLDLVIEHQHETWILRLSPYLYYFDNFIFLRPTAQFSLLPEAGQLYQYQQAPSLQGGGELFFDWHPWENLHLSNATELLINQNLDTRLPLPFSPPWNNRLKIAWEADRWYVGANWRWTLDQDRTDRNEARTPGYHLFGLEAGYQLKWSRQSLSFDLAVQNLFDQFYLRHLSRYRILNLPEQGRNIVLGIHYKF